ncbi:unnamed protein product [Rotaria socialis]
MGKEQPVFPYMDIWSSTVKEENTAVKLSKYQSTIRLYLNFPLIILNSISSTTRTHRHSHSSEKLKSKMQLIFILLVTLICGYSLVSTAPIGPNNKTNPDTLETKQQKATAIASRLLKELAHEQHTSDSDEQLSTNDENKNFNAPANHPEIEKAELHLSSESEDSADDDDEDIDFLPIINDLYDVYGNKYNQEPEDDESSSELADNEYVLPMTREQLIRYFAEEEDNDENLQPVINSQVMDDSIMAAENH